MDEWWEAAFTPADRALIADAYRPLGSTGMPLVEGDVQRQQELHAGPFLATLATWVAKPSHGDLPFRIAEKASSFDTPPDDPWQAHFMFANLCKVFYRFRESHTDALAKAVWACEQDISLSSKLDPSCYGDGIVVSHHCFKQLAVIEEKRRNFDRAIEICCQADAQGWRGDWDKRIARLRKKLAEQARAD